MQQFRCHPSIIVTSFSNVIQHHRYQHTHLGQTDGTLLGRHVASARVDLREFSDVVLPVLFCFAFGKVRPPESCKKAQYSSPDATATGCLQTKHLLTSGLTSQEPYFISSSLMSSNLFMLGNLSCISFLTPRLMPTGTTFRLLQVGNTSACVSVTFYQ